jgi:hypothetical protein
MNAHTEQRAEVRADHVKLWAPCPNGLRRERLRAAGVDVVSHEYPWQIHAFVSLTKVIPQGLACTVRSRIISAGTFGRRRGLREPGPSAPA